MALVVGICELTLGLFDVASLKEKRSVVRRVVDRTRQRFPVSIAEVDEQDLLAVAVVAFAIVSSNRRFVNSLVDKVVAAIDEMGLARLESHDFEILNY